MGVCNSKRESKRERNREKDRERERERERGGRQTNKLRKQTKGEKKDIVTST